MATNRPASLQIYDPILTGIARSYRPKGFIARQLLPTIPVTTLSGQYPVFDKQFWFQNDVDTRVADRAPAREIDFEWSTETYLAEEHALKVSISDLEREQAQAVGDPLRFEQAKTDLLSSRIELGYEVEVANLLRKTSNGGGLNLGADAGGDWATATDIEADIKTGVLAVYAKTGQVPNVIVIPFLVAYAMAVNTTIRGLLRYDAAGKAVNFIELGDRVLPSVIHGMQVIIPQGVGIDAGRQGNPAADITEVWGDAVRLLVIDSSAQWGEPSVAYRMDHTAKRVTRWRQTDPDLEYIREMERYDLKVVAPDAGYEIANTL